MNHVRQRLGVSERRACRVMGHARSTHRHLARLPADEPRFVSRMIELATTDDGGHGLLSGWSRSLRFYAAIDSSLHTWSASNAVRFLTTANA